MRRLIEPDRLDPRALGLLALAALCVLVAGLQHARLFHRGYGEVEIVGLLFFMNAIGSTGVVLMLIFDRAWLYPGKLMPTDFAARMSDDDIAALAAFVAAASGGEAAGGGDDGRGRGRGRGGD